MSIDWQSAKVPGDPKLAKVKKKLDSLVFPEIKLKDLTLTEAIELLQMESVAQDQEGRVLL